MKVHIQGGGVEITPALQEYINEKIGSLAHFVERWEERGSVEAWIEVSRTRHHRHGDVFTVAVDIRLPRKVLRAEHADEDVRVAVDVTRDTLKRELEHYKEARIEVFKRRRRQRE